jgi:aspartyl/glutamyl-tRNA(Asn/Gln) amidotransferase C subunit
MVIITKDEVLKIALMSRISIHEDEIETVIRQLESVLAYAQRVNEIAAIQERVVQNTNIFRADVAHPTPAAPLLARGPAVQENFFVVPAILDSSTGSL